jgi:glycosyltransferase involved in cell wall biosynthesis
LKNSISVVIPAYNEEESIEEVVRQCRATLGEDVELLIIDDGSIDATGQIAEVAGATVIRHPYNKGNGAAAKTGIWKARGEIIILLDGDGQHQPSDIPRLLKSIERFDMVVGARTDDSDIQLHRKWANRIFNALASYIVGRPVKDLTSGFRVIRAPLAKRFAYLLPNGFSYPTTITLALFRAGHSVHYEPIVAPARHGQSKIRLIRDGLGFLLTLTRIGTLFAPMKIFLPIAVTAVVLGVGYGGYLIFFFRRFSNMPVLLILSGIMLFMLGLISEQIALLRMSQAEHFYDPEEPL